MTYRQLRERASFLAMQAGWPDTSPEPDWPALVNRGLQDFSWDTEYNIESLTFPTVASQAEYTLATPYWKYIVDLVRDTDTCMYLTDEQQIRNWNRLWMEQSISAPTRYWMVMPNVIHLFPTPDNVYTMSLRGVREAPPMSADTDIPAFPTTWHEAVALEAAILHCEPWAAGPALDKVELYRSKYAGQVKAMRAWLNTDNRQKQLTVMPRVPERVGLSGIRGGAAWPW